MKTVTSPVRLGDGRLLRHKRNNPVGMAEWHAADGLRVLVEPVTEYGSHVSVSNRGRAPSSADVALVRAVFFEADDKVTEGKVSSAGVVHLIESRCRQEAKS